MSAEIVRHALEKARQTAFNGMKQIIRSGADLDLILFLLDENGQLKLVAWTATTRPPDALEVITTMCRESGAVAALFVAEFNGTGTNGGYRVAAVHWCYPEDGISESAFFVLDPEDEGMAEERWVSVDIPEHLIDWLDEALVASQVTT